MTRLVLLLIATVVMVQFASADDHHNVGCERRDHRCGPSVNCSLCDHGRCCSCDGYCGGGDNYCGLYSCAYQCPDYNTTCTPYTKSYYYSDVKDTGVEESVVLDLSGAGRVGCAVYHVNMSMGWIQEHGPTVFCNRKPAAAEATAESNGTISTSDACGKCLKVTRSETGTQTIVKLLEDECNTKGPLLGNTIFQKLDTDGKGAAQGYLAVEYQNVPCDKN